MLITGYPYTLVSNWESVIDSIAADANELLSNGTILGFFLGDELVGVR